MKPIIWITEVWNTFNDNRAPRKLVPWVWCPVTCRQFCDIYRPSYGDNETRCSSLILSSYLPSETYFTWQDSSYHGDFQLFIIPATFYRDYVAAWGQKLYSSPKEFIHMIELYFSLHGGICRFSSSLRLPTWAPNFPEHSYHLVRVFTGLGIVVRSIHHFHPCRC
jgi:hypothetical protein